MTAPEYHKWLATLTIEARAAVEQAVGIVMDSLLMLEGRMAVSEVELKQMSVDIEMMNKRISELEHIVAYYEH